MSFSVVKNLLALGIFAATLLSFPVIERSLRAYHKTLFHTFSHFEEYHQHSMTPNIGDETVPGPAIEIRETVKRLNLSSFKLSVEYSKNGWNYQQTVVSLWPIHNEADSPYLFQIKSESTPDHCELMNETGELKLVHCH